MLFSIAADARDIRHETCDIGHPRDGNSNRVAVYQARNGLSIQASVGVDSGNPQFDYTASAAVEPGCVVRGMLELRYDNVALQASSQKGRCNLVERFGTPFRENDLIGIGIDKGGDLRPGIRKQPGCSG